MGCFSSDFNMKSLSWILRGATVITRILESRRRGQKLKDHRDGSVRGLDPTLLALKVEEGDDEPRNVGGCLEARKGKEMDSCPEPLERNAALLIPRF